MRFRQWISPTYKNLYDACLNQAPFYSNETIKETRPDHSYCRPWIDDPTISTALPRVQLFLNSTSINDSIIDIDDNQKLINENIKNINWTPTINTIIPDIFECLQQTNENLTQEQQIFIQDICELINETHIASLCCESNNCNVVYWRLSIHHIVAKLYSLLTLHSNIRQLYPNHHIMFLGWNVGCILALKAALVCSVSSVICMSPPFEALSEETKNDFTQINASILFITGEKQYTNQIDHYRQRLKSRNGLIELGQCDDKLYMSENGKYRFRLTQQLIDKLIMEEILDFIIIISPRSNRTPFEEVDDENKKKKTEHVPSTTLSYIEDSEEPFLYTGLNSNDITSTTLTIPPEQDPNSIFLNTILPTSTSTRKRKGSTLTNLLENDRSTGTITTNSSNTTTTTKRGRHRTKNLPPIDDMEWAPDKEKRPIKSTNKKQNKQTIPPPTSTTSILNTLLQLPSNQPKQRINETNIIKTIHQQPSFVNTVLSSNPFH
ncbi:unnamed protein product [Rotaria sp. Silwood1]|nr:unnamed protein product [Rotaria sp. Silwood1]